MEGYRRGGRPAREITGPSAKVEHNVRRPVLGKPSRRPRQCDVAITSGPPHHPTVSIVEVQKRDSKPNITTFHGWYHKMQEVGAQHLICVSTRGYPKSIIDEAADIGPTVRLLTLNQLREPTMSNLIFLAPFIIHRKPKWTYEEVGPKIKLDGYSTDLSFLSIDKLFTLDDSQEFQSISDLINVEMNAISDVSLQQQMEPPDNYIQELILGSADRTLWLHIDGKPYKVLSLPTRIKVQTNVSTIPLTAFEYHQESIGGVLAWVAVAEGIVGEKHISVRYVFGKDEKGFLRVLSVYQEGVKSAGLVVSHEKRAIDDYIQKSLQNSQ